MKRDVTMVVLTAGIGKRFAPFRTDKTLFPFLGKKVIDYALPNKLPPEVVRLVLVVSERNRETFDAMRFPVQHTVVVQNEATGMAGAILAAKNEIRKKAILVVIGDDVADDRLIDTVLQSVRPDVSGVIVGWKPKQYFPGGYLVFREGRPVGIKEKPGEGKTPSEYVYFGGQYIADADSLIAAIESAPEQTDDRYEQALTALMAKERFVMVPYEREFVSLKYPWHVLDMTEYLLTHRLVAGRGKRVEIRNNVSIEGPVYLGNNVKIFENTKIVGPVYIGDNTIVGNNNIIRDSIIGENCVTGFNTDITRSYIGDNCWFHSNYVGDSVLEGDVSMGSGSVLANLRLDEGEISSVVGEQKINTRKTKLGAMIGRGVRIGVNTSVMPGVKIGANSLIGAGILLDADIPADSFCTGKSTLVVKKNTRAVGTNNRDKYKAKI